MDTFLEILKVGGIIIGIMIVLGVIASSFGNY